MSQKEINKTRDLLEVIPYDLILWILVEADNETIFTCFCVCKTWNSFAESNHLFKEISRRRYDLENYFYKKSIDWKWIFFSKLKTQWSRPTSGFQLDYDNDDDEPTEPKSHLLRFMNGEIGSKQIAGGLYEGEFRDRKRHGNGTYYWQTNDPTKFQVRYCGDWVNDQRTGNGYCDWKSGSIYIGEFKNDQICGKGKFFWAHGDVYDGNFDENGNKSNFGEFRWKSGNKYEGFWELSKRSGHGKFTWYNGDVYDGKWVDDVKSGKGKLIWNNGNSFDGVWVNGQKEKGVMYERVTNRSFEGNFDDGEMHMEFLHPDIIDCIEKKMCTSVVTGKNCYFQYLWQTNECSDRTHGVCITCKNYCVEKNYTSLLDPNKRYLGGNFFCECGVIFGSSCRRKDQQKELLTQEDEENAIF